MGLGILYPAFVPAFAPPRRLEAQYDSDGPRQPACAAATASPASEAISTGRQSAVRIAQMRPGTRVTPPSAVGAAASTFPGETSKSAIRTPCT